MILLAVFRLRLFAQMFSGSFARLVFQSGSKIML